MKKYGIILIIVGYWVFKPRLTMPSREPIEARALAELLLSDWDRDGDGVIQVKEWPAEPLGVASLFPGKSEVPVDAVLGPLALWLKFPREGEPGKRWFTLADADKNDVLDTDELAKLRRLDPTVDAFDLDGNGTVTVEEVDQAMLPPQNWRPIKIGLRVLESFEKLDRNKDELLSKRELRRSDYLVDALDRDRDQHLSRKELKALEDFARKGPQAFERYALGTRFLAMDANRDGALSSKEVGRGKVFFDRLDADKDGAVVAAEFERWHTVMESFLVPVFKE
jgi:Ca2+-binding EF-hand superfamily protein